MRSIFYKDSTTLKHHMTTHLAHLRPCCHHHQLRANPATTSTRSDSRQATRSPTRSANTRSTNTRASTSSRHAYQLVYTRDTNTGITIDPQFPRSRIPTIRARNSSATKAASSFETSLSSPSRLLRGRSYTKSQRSGISRDCYQRHPRQLHKLCVDTRHSLPFRRKLRGF
jgi:hypothetical protein